MRRTTTPGHLVLGTMDYGTVIDEVRAAALLERYVDRGGEWLDTAASGHRTYSEDDAFWIGLVTCLRDAGLGIADLREFTTLLRADGDRGDRVAFLQQHKAELEDRARRIHLAISVLTEKIDYYGRLG